jgi:acetyl esterase/lipase
MRIEDYPPQEPFTAIGARYHEEALRLGAGVEGRDVAYGEDPYQRLLVVPAPRPTGEVLVFLHGGGWTNGYKEWMAFMAPAVTAAGVSFVSAGYRLAPAHLFPAGLRDSAAALARVAVLAPELGGDAGRIFLGGHSAGGHYAALLALSPALRPDVALRGCLPVSGVFDFGAESGLSMRPRFLGAEGNGAEAAASPIRLVAPGAPPFLLAHGDRDFPHLIRQAEAFEAALRAASVPVERIVLPDADHLGASYEAGRADGAWWPRALGWMRAQG